MNRLMKQLSISLGAAAAVALAPDLTLARDAGAQPGDAPAATNAPSEVLSVEELMDNAAGYAGKRVTVAGEVEDKLDARSFVIESGGIFDDEVTVIVGGNTAGIAPANLDDDADVVVTGTLRSASVVEIERELGWDLNAEVEAEFEGTRYYLVADRISYQPATPQRQARRGTMGAGTRGTAADRVLDVERLMDNAEAYVGNQVTVAGEIDDRINARSFVIESGGMFDDEIPVIVRRNAAGTAPANLDDDADIVVTGTLRLVLMDEIRRELGGDLGADLESEIADNRYYILADRISYQPATGQRQARRGTVDNIERRAPNSGDEPKGGNTNK